jgi:hypothetical protein
MFKTAWFLVSLVSLVAPAGAHSAAADEAPELPSVEDLSFAPEVFLVSDQHKKDCARMGSICPYANGGGTIAGVDIDPTVGIVTTLERGTQVAATSHMGSIPAAEVWHVELIARFRSRTVAGEPITLALMDYADPDGMAKKEATAVWQIDGAVAKDLGVRLVLSDEDGFQPRHTYLIRMVQGVGDGERILAEGSFLLE